MGQQFGLYFLNIQMQVNFNFRKYNYILKENHKLFQNRIVIWHSYWFFFFFYFVLHTGISPLEATPQFSISDMFAPSPPAPSTPASSLLLGSDGCYPSWTVRRRRHPGDGDMKTGSSFCPRSDYEIIVPSLSYLNPNFYATGNGNPSYLCFLYLSSLFWADKYEP